MNKEDLNKLKKKYFRINVKTRNKKKNLAEYNKKFKETEKYFYQNNFNQKKIFDYIKNYNKNGYRIRGNNFDKLINKSFFKNNLFEIEKILKKVSSSNTNIYELGSGFGRIIIALLFNKFNKFNKFYACDINKVGLNIIDKVSQKNNLKIDTVKFDFLNIKKLKFIKDNSIIYTYNSIMCVPNLKRNFFEILLKKKPKFVIHFEATYVDKPINNLQKFSKQYFLNCDYNKTFLKKLKSLENEKKIELKILERKISSNLLLNEKIIIWKPLNKKIKF